MPDTPSAPPESPLPKVLRLALLLAASATAQDPASLAPGLVRLENDRVRVLAPRYAPGEGMGMHDHPARIVVFLTDATLEVTLPDGSKRTLERKALQVEATPPTKHAVRNTGYRPLEAIEVELKGPATSLAGDAAAARPDGPKDGASGAAAARSAEPTPRPPGGAGGGAPPPNAAAEDPTHTTLLLDDERARVYLTRLAPGASTAAHGHGESVVIVLTGGRVRTTVEGMDPSEAEVGRREVSFRPPTRHVLANVGLTPYEAIVVELKPTPSPKAVPTPSAAPEPVRFTGLRLEVAEAERAFARTMARRDLAGFRSFLSAEAVFFSGAQPVRGPEGVVSAWKRFFEGPVAPFSWEPTEVEVLDSGTLALSSGPVRNPKGELVGTFTSIWRLEAPGTWRVVFDKGCQACPPRP